MENFLLYLLKVSTGTVIFYSCYFLFFSTDTFYMRNRIYLLISLILSFIIPLVKISSFSNVISTIEPVKKINDIILSGAVAETAIAGKISSNILNNLVVWIYFSIAGLIFLKVIISVAKAYSIIRKGTIHDTAFPRIILSEMGYPPFSFFPYIVIPKNKFESSDYPEILKHENAHVRQGHTFDLILSEVLIALLWFNPFMWLIKRSIILNHEYLADNHALKNSGSIKEYQYKLLNIPKDLSFVPLAHNYSSSVKKRIVMINKRPTRNYAALKNVIFLPLLTTLLVMCSLKTEELIPGNGSSEQSFSGYRGTSGNEKFVSINDYRNSEVPKTDLSKHKDRDFEVFRVKYDTRGDLYYFTTYQLKNSQLEEHTGMALILKDDYDKASYKWVNDSSLVFNLINQSKKMVLSYRLDYYKNGNTSLGVVQDSTK
jgi:beta-lactamase regulating signal transducer with metallopeptidase domain